MNEDLGVSMELPPLPTSTEQEAGEHLRRRTLEVLASYLAGMHLFDGSVSPAEWVVAHKLPSYFERWLRESMRLCATMSTSTERAPERLVEDAWGNWNEGRSVWFEVPTLRGRGVLAEVMLRALPSILRGETTALEALFRSSTQRLVRAVYGGQERADYFHKLAARIALRHMAHLCEAGVGKFSVLEIGAGTGSTTAHVLEALSNHEERIEEYCYSDISRSFLSSGRQRFAAGRDFMTFRPFNVEVLPERQGLNLGHFDLIIAANVMHATRRISESARNARRLLAQKGLLLLIEVLGSNNIIGHVTFGLLEGWWRSEELNLRVHDGAPSVAPASWRAVLEASGFENVCFPAEHAHVLGQQIIVASGRAIDA